MHRLILTISRLMAILGGIVLSALIGIVCLSILGRTANSILQADIVRSVAPGLADWLIDAGIGVIRGDFELVEAGMAFAVFAFLPLTQVTAGHATVDVFVRWLPDRALRLLRAVIEALFAVVLVVIAIQLMAGARGRFVSGQTTFLLEFPIWWSYAASAACAAVAAIVGLYMAFVRIIEATTGRDIAPPEPETGH